jgi:hypothetical protein
MNIRGMVVLLCAMGALVSTSVCAQVDFSGPSGSYQYGYYSQLGRNGFFGDYDVDRGLSGSFSSLNSWIGNNTSDMGQIVSGANVSQQKISMEVNPRLVKDWVSAEAKAIISAYELGTVQGTYNPISPWLLSSWSVSADTPVARFRWGRIEFPQGFGLQFTAARSEDFIVAERDFNVPNLVGRLACCGLLPMKALRYFNPAGWVHFFSGTDERKAVDAEFAGAEKELKDEFGLESRCRGWNNCFPVTTGAEYGPGRLHIGFGAYARETIFIPASGTVASDAGIQVWNGQDANASFNQNLLLYATYFSSELAFGAGGLYRNSHQGPELQTTLTVKLDTPTKDVYLTEGWLYLLYNNGTYFINSELDWYNRIVRFQRSSSGFFRNPDVAQNPALPPLPAIVPDGSDRSLFAPQYIESWRFMFEAGRYCGPFSARFFYAFMPGRDRRHGILINKQPFLDFSRQQAVGPFAPYSILLSTVYSGGVNAPKHISDASVYAVKVDYALAANIVLELSYLRAIRNSHGFGWGSIRPLVNGAVSYVDPGTYLQPTPAIPDSDLGWEIVTGVTWKLLENFGVETRVAYWQPGRWFNYACVDRGVPGWDDPSPVNYWGINSNRRIDPVLSLEIRLGAEY